MRRYLTRPMLPHLIALIIGMFGLAIGIGVLVYLVVIGQPGVVLLIIVAGKCIHYTDKHFRVKD